MRNSKHNATRRNHDDLLAPNAALSSAHHTEVGSTLEQPNQAGCLTQLENTASQQAHASAEVPTQVLSELEQLVHSYGAVKNVMPDSAGLPPLRDRAQSEITMLEARKLGYNPCRPILLPQKSKENPPPFRLPSPVKNRLRPQPPPDDFALDDLSFNLSQIPQPSSAPEQINYEDRAIPIQEEEEVMYFGGADDEEDDEELQSEEDEPVRALAVKGQEELFDEMCLGQSMLHPSSATSPPSTTPSSPSILGFMERSVHEEAWSPASGEALRFM